jgi:predicted Zn-dependent peptidase
MMSADTFNTVVHGQFLKQIKIIEERQEFAERLPEGVKQYINSLSKPMPTEDRLLTEEEFEKKRNAILDQLEGRK